MNFATVVRRISEDTQKTKIQIAKNRKRRIKQRKWIPTKINILENAATYTLSRNTIDTSGSTKKNIAKTSQAHNDIIVGDKEASQTRKNILFELEDRKEQLTKALDEISTEKNDLHFQLIKASVGMKETEETMNRLNLSKSRKSASISSVKQKFKERKKRQFELKSKFQASVQYRNSLAHMISRYKYEAPYLKQNIRVLTKLVQSWDSQLIRVRHKERDAAQLYAKTNEEVKSLKAQMTKQKKMGEDQLNEARRSLNELRGMLQRQKSLSSDTYSKDNTKANDLEAEALNISSQHVKKKHQENRRNICRESFNMIYAMTGCNNVTDIHNYYAKQNQIQIELDATISNIHAQEIFEEQHLADMRIELQKFQETLNTSEHSARDITHGYDEAKVESVIRTAVLARQNFMQASRKLAQLQMVIETLYERFKSMDITLIDNSINESKSSKTKVMMNLQNKIKCTSKFQDESQGKENTRKYQNLGQKLLKYLRFIHQRTGEILSKKDHISAIKFSCDTSGSKRRNISSTFLTSSEYKSEAAISIQSNKPNNHEYDVPHIDFGTDEQNKNSSTDYQNLGLNYSVTNRYNNHISYENDNYDTVLEQDVKFARLELKKRSIHIIEKYANKTFQ